jgi:hypothetical protein
VFFLPVFIFLHIIFVGIFYSELFYMCYEPVRARGNEVGSGNMLQAGRSCVRVPMRWIFFNFHKSSSRNMALGWTQSVTEMSTRNFSGG